MVGVGHHQDQGEVVGEGVGHHQEVVVEQYQFLVVHHLLVYFVAACTKHDVHVHVQSCTCM